jgi:hypothetical protein
MISNLVDNAVRHDEPGGWIKLRTGSSDAAACLQIANSGPYVPDDAAPTLSSRSGACRPGPAPAKASGSACPSPGSVVTAHRAVTVRCQPDGGLDISVIIPGSRISPPDRSREHGTARAIGSARRADDAIGIEAIGGTKPIRGV